MAGESSTRRELLRKILTLGPLGALAGVLGANGTNGARPAAAMQTINDDLTVTGSLTVNGSSASAFTGGNLGIGPYLIADASNAALKSTANLNLVADDDNNGSGGFNFVTGGISGATRLTITNTGNVGIGAGPNSRLYVKSPSGSTEIRIDTASADVDAVLGFYENGVDKWVLFNDGDAGDVLKLVSNSTYALTVAQAGNVGIGTTSPVYPLDVVGSIHLTGIMEGTARQAYYAA